MNSCLPLEYALTRKVRPHAGVIIAYSVIKLKERHRAQRKIVSEAHIHF